MKEDCVTRKYRRLAALAVVASLGIGVGVLASAEGSNAGGSPLTDNPSPVRDALGIPGPVAQAADLSRVENSRQAAIRACMASKGFQYPTITSKPDDFLGGFAAVDSLQFAKTKGFGILSGAANGRDTGSKALAAILSHLSAEERARYQEALGSLSPQTGSTTGCLAAGEAAAAADPSAGYIQRTAASNEVMSQVKREIAADPRVVELNATWSDCMRGRGYEAATPPDLVKALADKLMGTLNADDLRGTTSNFKATQAIEIRAATANYECRSPMSAELTQITFAHETAFAATLK